MCVIGQRVSTAGFTIAPEQCLVLGLQIEHLTLDALRLQRRLQWQRGIREILAEQETALNKTDRLRQFFAGFEDIDDETMREKSAINRGVIVRLTVQISNSMTEDQQAHFISKTNDYIRMLTELAENR